MKCVRNHGSLTAIAFAASTVLLGAAQPAPAPTLAELLTPDAIYLRAIRAMKAEPEPTYVIFDEDVRARNARLECTQDGESLTIKHGDVQGRYRVWFRVRDGASVSQDSQSHRICNGALLQPTGANIVSLGTAQASPAPAASPSAASGDANTQGDASSATMDNHALIGSVRVEAARYYRITLVGHDDFEGHDVYRLALHAYRDPNTHPITELLVDTATFLVRRASGEVSGHYVIASGRGAGTVVFDRAGAYWVVRDEDFEFAANALFIHLRTNLAVRGSDYLYAESLPGVTFPSPSPSPQPRETK